VSIARAIVAAHGGHISATSAPGEGTRIVFELPTSGRTKVPTKPGTV
jgi:signal transduction histidine kinase